tara:strand:- start:28 stop:234 length:207 start_codon:yes stop_codon:yes gene_type:complete
MVILVKSGSELPLIEFAAIELVAIGFQIAILNSFSGIKNFISNRTLKSGSVSWQHWIFRNTSFKSTAS